MNWLAMKWWWDRLLNSGTFDHPDEDEKVENQSSAAEELVQNQRSRVQTVGAWAGYGAFATESKAIASANFAASVGLNRIDIIANDYSKNRDQSPFRIYDRKKIVGFSKILLEHGIQPHLMTWVMPHAGFIVSMGGIIQEVMAEGRIQSVMLDAEEPWTLAKQPLDWQEAADMVKSALGDVDWGVTGIGYASKEKLGPLVRNAGYACPQCYATSRNNLKVETASRTLSERWARNFGEKRLVVGLPAYRQDRAGYTREDFMNAALASAMTMNPESIVYWSLRHIRSSSKTTRIVKQLAAHAMTIN